MNALQCAVIAFLAVVVSCHGHHHHHLMCPPPFGKMMFDPERFQGEWYVVSHYVESPHKHGEDTCARLKYVPSKEGNESRVQMTMQMRWSGGEEHKLEMRCVQGGPPGKGGASSLCALRLDESDKWGPLMQHQVLATDYESYAIVQACGVFYKEDDQKFNRVFVVKVLSREPSLPAETLRLLKSVASSGEATFDSFKDVNNDGC